MGAGYRLFLVPVDDDGKISASFLEEAQGVAPAVSQDQPIDMDAARSLLLAELPVMEGVCRRLQRLAEVLPVPVGQVAMFDDLVPCDAATFMFGAMEYATGETLPSTVERLRRAATATDDELRRDFFERQVRYLAEQASRPGKPHMRDRPQGA